VFFGLNKNGALAGLAVFAMILAMIAAGAVRDSYSQSAKTHVVVIEGVKFIPETIELNLGDTVTWKNKDAFPHTATAEDKSFDSGSFGANRSWTFKARKKGIFPYVCTLHPTMKGTLVVK
jgi:plastocyanin